MDFINGRFPSEQAALEALEPFIAQVTGEIGAYTHTHIIIITSHTYTHITSHHTHIHGVCMDGVWLGMRFLFVLV